MAQIKHNTIWAPQPGPQHLFVKCPYFDVLFGGARGGGKSDACLGEFAIHAIKYGRHARGVFMRREMPQADSLIDRSHDIYGPLGWTFAKVDRQWVSPEGAILRFRPLEDDRDAEKFQGQQFCVAVGTKVRMSDGSFKPIEAISAGESVATLLGPRRVLGVVDPYVAECVRALVRASSGVVLGEQVHPVWHPVLTTAGLSLTRTGSCSRSLWQSGPAGSASNTRLSGCPPCEGREIRGWASFLSGAASGCASSGWTRQEYRKRGRSIVPVVLHGPSGRLSALSCRGSLGLPTGYHSHGKSTGSYSGQYSALQRVQQRLWQGLERAGGLAQSGLGLSGLGLTSAGLCGPCGFEGVQGFLAGYHGGRGSSDEPSPRGPESGLSCTPRQADVGIPSHARPSGGSGTIPSNIHPGQASWVHPYTGEELGLAEDVSPGTMEIEYHGPCLVTDLCVEEANHYITEGGLINKNTRLYMEELTNWPSPRGPDKMKATLRSASGVPARFRATANPGGAGHHWVKDRYIDPAPGGMVPLMDEGGKMERVFIPARVSDNLALIKNDPDYPDRLRLSGSKELVRAWLEGDWAVVEGAFFDNFSSSRHIVKPFEIPKQWTRFRSMDWGSAAPFSVGWYSVCSDDLPLGDGRTLPRGGLVKYREWYGASGPNVGIKLTAEDVASGISKREALDTLDYGVIDPAAFAQNGGPSIAERLRVKPMFRPADNKRVGTLGHFAGWDLVRHRLDGEAPDRPMLIFFDTCADTIRTLPMLQHDAARTEDLDTSSEDHCFAGDTIVLANGGRFRIADLVGTAGSVVTAGGCQAKYHSCRMTRRDAEVVRVTFDNGSEVTCTPDHKFLTVAGWVEAKDLSGKILLPFQRLAKSSWGSGITARTAKPVRCVSVDRLSERQDVYCLTVPETGCFALDGGIIAHNCADEIRYACASRPWIKKDHSRVKPLVGMDGVNLNLLWKRKEKRMVRL